MIDEPIRTVERDRQNQEARTEAKISRTRVVQKQSKKAVSFDRDKYRHCGQRNHESKELKKCFECGSPNHLKRNCPYLNEN